MSCETFYMLLNGFILMEFRNGLLTVTTPEVSGHEFLIGNPTPSTNGNSSGVSGREWHGNVDFCKILTGGKVTTFPKAVPKFSRSATGVGDIKWSEATRTVTLPLPIKIFTLRRGGKRNVFKAGKVWTNLQQRTDPSPCAVTCLRYELCSPHSEWEWALEKKCHIYVGQPRSIRDRGHVAMVLELTGQMFSNPKAFDLQVDPLKNGYLNPPLRAGFGGLNENDERNLDEFGHLATATDVINCGLIGQVGIIS